MEAVLQSENKGDRKRNGIINSIDELRWFFSWFQSGFSLPDLFQFFRLKMIS